MKNNKIILATIITLLLLNSCGTISEGLGGTKKKGADEFLVQKKSPLVLPPSFGELPEPNKQMVKNTDSTEENKSSIEKIITQGSSTDTNKENNKISSSIENSIIEKINEKKIKKISLDKKVEEKKETTKKKGFFKRLKAKFTNLEH